jgi:lysozyme family protein
MADYRLIVPFIKGKEGGISNKKSDMASADPVPDGSGNHTNKGITWTTWKSVFGSDADSIKRFYAMSDADWGKVYKGEYWDKIGGDKINSQRIADTLVHWAWGSGLGFPSKAIQKIVGISPITGVIGDKTITAINNSNEPDTYAKIKQAHIDHWNNLLKNPKYAMNTGWTSRLNDLFGNYMTSIKDVVSSGVTTGVNKAKKNPIVTGIIVLTIIGGIFLIYKATKTKK